MKIEMRFPVVLVICAAVLVGAKEDYENKLTKLWSMTGSTNSDGSAVLNVTSASIVIQPSSYGNEKTYVPNRQSRDSEPANRRYVFKPRAIPLARNVEGNNVYYAQDNINKYKSEVLFPGNYFNIAKEKSDVNQTAYNPLEGGPFQPKAIPLIRNQEFQRRSLDVDEEPTIEKPAGFSEQNAQRRSLSYFLGIDEAEDDRDDDEDELEENDVEGIKRGHKIKIKKPKKLKKYMLPLLLAYKMKYFALVPVMISGLVLLVGATGIAGFFFALFAAVMGLQKGSGY